MMHDNVWNWGMGWEMWLVPLLVIVVILYFVRFKRRK